MSQHLDSLQCSFCGKFQGQVKRLIAGPAVYICEQCIVTCTSFLLEEDAGARGEVTAVSEVSSRCDFCGRKRPEVWQLVGVAGCKICSGCVEICNEILGDYGDEEAASEEWLRRLREHNGGKLRGYVRGVLGRRGGHKSAAI